MKATLQLVVVSLLSYSILPAAEAAGQHILATVLSKLETLEQRQQEQELEIVRLREANRLKDEKVVELESRLEQQTRVLQVPTFNFNEMAALFKDMSLPF